MIAAHKYDLKLLPASTENHDAQAKDGRFVQIKATQRKTIGLCSKPEMLLVFKITRDGSVKEVYNGPGYPAWEAAGPIQKNGQRPISLHKLIKLSKLVDHSDRLELSI